MLVDSEKTYLLEHLGCELTGKTATEHERLQMVYILSNICAEGDPKYKNEVVSRCQIT